MDTAHADPAQEEGERRPSLIEASAGVFVVANDGAASRVPGRAVEYRPELVIDLVDPVTEHSGSHES